MVAANFVKDAADVLAAAVVVVSLSGDPSNLVQFFLFSCSAASIFVRVRW